VDSDRWVARRRRTPARYTGEKERDRPLVEFMMARAGYFETLGIRTLAGRVFEPTRPGGVREAVIDRSLADRVYPGCSAEETLSVALRTGGSPSGFVPEVRAADGRIDPQLAIADVQSMDDVMREEVQPRPITVLLAGFSLGARLLAAMGLYDVVAGPVDRAGTKWRCAWHWAPILVTCWDWCSGRAHRSSGWDC
jgi:hypothetical protein